MKLNPYLFNLFTLFILLLTSCDEGNTPKGRDFPDAAREIYILNGLAESISLLNPSTLEMRSHVMLTGMVPNDLVYYEDKLFVVNSGSNSLSIFNESSFALIKEMDLGPNRNPMKLIVDDSGRGWITNLMRGTLSVVDMETLEFLFSGEEEISVGTAPEGGDFLNHRVFVCNTGGYNADTQDFAAGSLSVIDSRNFDFQTLALPENANPRSARAFPQWNQLHVYLTGLQSQDDGQILVYQVPEDDGDVVFLNSYSIGGSPAFSGSAWDSVNQRVYLSGQGGISVYNPGDMEMLFPSSEYFFPESADYSTLFGGVAVDSQLERLFITDFNHDNLYVLEKEGESYSLIEKLGGDDGVQIPVLVEE